MEQERVAEREPGLPGGSVYEGILRFWDDLQSQARSGAVIVRGKEVPWEQSRQGRLKYFVHRFSTHLALRDMSVFLHEIRTHSGKHRHQGGVAIFVVEGEGYTTIGDQRVDWEQGDLILVPIVPGGVEHQHFNRVPGKPCTWLAFSYYSDRESMGITMTQVENSPDYKG